MTCRELAEFLYAYVSGESPPEERARFDAHLALCPDCVAYLESYRRTIELGQMAYADPAGVSPPDVPESLVRAILAARKK